jgi:hypothetical protein
VVPTLALSSQVNPCLEASLTNTAAAVVRRKYDFVPFHDLTHKAYLAVGYAVDFSVKNVAVAAVVAGNRNGLVEGPRGLEDAARCTEIYSRAHCLSL